MTATFAAAHRTVTVLLLTAFSTATPLRSDQVAARRDPAHSVAPGSGKSFRDCADVCPEMVIVPAGSFMMGSPAGEAGRENSEGPQRKITFAKPFAVGKFEVTFAEWDACVAAGACRNKPKMEGGRGRQPVHSISWNDIVNDYLPWLSRKAGLTYRMLTETEWEYAARAGTTTPFATGTNINSDQANFDDRFAWGGGGQWRERSVEVGSFAANAWGLHDMHGNVWEWVQDCANTLDTYAPAPTDGSAVLHTADCPRVFRGGSWFHVSGPLRSAYRDRAGTMDNRLPDLGFRVARYLK
jgi:formylglycine-generating enzyme required for sulfatase activity